jgi:putative N6-adenine-specific DNA methylase
VLAGNKELTGSIGLKASRRMVFFNGTIECRLLKYELYKGSRGDRSDKDKAEG